MAVWLNAPYMMHCNGLDGFDGLDGALTALEDALDHLV